MASATVNDCPFYNTPWQLNKGRTLFLQLFVAVIPDGQRDSPVCIRTNCSARQEALKSYRYQVKTMTIQYVTGDLFLNRHNAQALAHGCNCKGAMGAGVARGFRERYPDMYEEYRLRCRAEPPQFNLGDSFFWKASNKPWVFNLATQEDYRHCRASCGAIEKALREMKRQADEEGIGSIAMPRIGAGYGGLSWENVRPVIEKVFDNWPGTLYVYGEYVPGE
jgi:O-acetyl-ADP-ribose deacetylase (regulator of RNase III)